MCNANKLHKTSWQLNDGGKCRENFDITPALAWLEHIEKGGAGGGREKGKVKKEDRISLSQYSLRLLRYVFL